MRTTLGAWCVTGAGILLYAAAFFLLIIGGTFQVVAVGINYSGCKRTCCPNTADSRSFCVNGISGRLLPEQIWGPLTD